MFYDHPFVVIAPRSGEIYPPIFTFVGIFAFNDVLLLYLYLISIYTY